MTLDRAREVAETGVDFLAVGSLTHSVRALDIALDLRPAHRKRRSRRERAVRQRAQRTDDVQPLRQGPAGPALAGLDRCSAYG